MQEAIQAATGLEPSVKAATNAAEMKAAKMDAARADADPQGDVLSAVTQLLNQSQEVGKCLPLSSQSNRYHGGGYCCMWICKSHCCFE